MREFFYNLKNKVLKYKSLFVKEEIQISEDKKIEKPKIKIKTKKESALLYQNNKRILALSNTDCALVMHDNGQCEVIFTKYNKDDQSFTPNEELLMALTIFLKQPGFGDMLIAEFQRVATNNSKKLFEKEENKEENKGDN